MIRTALCALLFLGLAFGAAAQGPRDETLEACRSYNSVVAASRDAAEQALARTDARVRALDAETKALRARLAEMEKVKP